MKELKLKQTVQGPIKRKQTFSLMLSLSLVQQCLLPENRPFFRSRTNDYTAQCLTHWKAFLRLYVNDCNYNKSYLGTCISRLVPLIAQQQYILPRDVFWNLFSLANLVPKLSPDICLGKGLIELLQHWGILFTYFQQLVEKYIRSHLNYWDKYSFYPLLISISEAFSDLSLYTKFSMTETYLWSQN